MDTDMIKRLQAVVFDMDGLMFDSEHYVQMSWDVAGEKLGYGKLGYHIVNTIGLNRENRKRYFESQYGKKFPYDLFQETYRDAYHELEGDGVPPKKGLHELIEFLQAKEIKMAVATSSSREHAIANLKREGISEYFEAVVTGDMIAHGKPEPDIYLCACEKLGVEPEYAMALEDSPAGIQAAYRAGMLPVMVPDLVRDTSKAEPFLFACCVDLLELKEQLQKILTKKVTEEKPYWEGKGYSYFSNRECEYFPCHKTKDVDNFNCLFCYCPLYALGENCGGNFQYMENGIKDCTNCLLPHKRENYGYVVGKFSEIAKLAEKKQRTDV